MTRLEFLQVELYVMTGKGFLGYFFASQPADAYIDLRVGRLPYSRKEIRAIQKLLIEQARQDGLDPHALPFNRP